MQELIKIIKENLANDMDSVCAVTGFEGVGKSTLTIHLGKMLDDQFGILRNIIFQPTVDKIENMIFNLPKFSPVIVDEAMRTMYKRAFMTANSRELNTLFSICRKQNKPIFLNIPNFFDLDTYYRNYRIKVWLFLPERGLAMVFMKDPSPFVRDCWYKDENQKMIEKYTRKSKFSIPLLKDALRNTKNYVYEFTFPDLPDREKDLYRYYSEKFAMQRSQMEDVWKRKFILLLKYIRSFNEDCDGLSFRNIAKGLNMKSHAPLVQLAQKEVKVVG